MTKNPYLKECPSEEELNAWYDSELRDPVLEDHLARCPKCRNILRSYLEIDSEIQGNLSFAYDLKMASRIRSRSMARIRGRRRFRLLYLNTWGRVAACAVIAVLVLVIRNRFKEFSENLADDAVQTMAKRPAKLVRNVPTVASSLIPAAKSAASELETIGAIHLDQALLLAYGTYNENLRETPAARRQPAEIAGTVIHTWLVDDPSAPVELLKGMMPDEFREDFDLLIRESADQCTLVMAIPNRELRKLVNYFDEIGFTLKDRSGHKPSSQPEAEVSNPPLRYIVDFVRLPQALTRD